MNFYTVLVYVMTLYFSIIIYFSTEQRFSIGALSKDLSDYNGFGWWGYETFINYKLDLSA